MTNNASLKKYFQQHQEKLQESYPGLTYNRIILEFNDFRQLHPESDSYSQFLEKIREGIPLEYINQKAFFYNSEFYVNGHVLIPRSETELLVEECLNRLKDFKGVPTIADVGTGSGAIILSLMREYSKPVNASAIDISLEALKVAKRNYFNLEFSISQESKIEFCHQDRFENDSQVYDFILSNPPYIKKNSDLRLVHENVAKYEPEVALFIEDEKYESWFDNFFGQVNSRLSDDGTFLMEGHEDHWNILLPILEENGLRSEKILNDLTGRPRILVARKSTWIN